jgi:hypothetical protein
MAALSILLGVLSLACVALGVLTTPIPVLGALFSFAAPLVAIAGIVVGGLAMSRSQQAAARPVTPGEPAPAAAPTRRVGLPGVIVSAVALLPALLTAMTCGVCNALCSTGQIQTRRDFNFDIQRGRPPAAPPRDTPDAGREPGDPDAPPPVFPPPPLDPR